MAPEKTDILTNSITHIYALKCYPVLAPARPTLPVSERVISVLFGYLKLRPAWSGR